MKSVVFVAPVLTQSGYGVHARQLAKWLLDRKDIDLKIFPLSWGDTPWLLDTELHDGLLKRIMERTVSQSDIKNADVSVQLQLPNEWNPNLAKINIGVTAGVETDVCNSSWVEACNKMSLVIVPSKHTKDTLEKSGKLTTSVVVVPEAYPNALLNPKQLNLKLEAENNFLLVSQLTGNSVHTDRKNIFLTLKWIIETFHDRKDVGIVLKTNSGRNSHIDRRLTTNVIRQVVSEIKSRIPGALPKVHLIHGTMTDEEMSGLYTHPKINALISLTRGEGFGLPLLEAAVCGLPVIATGWSGHIDFLSKGNYLNVDYTLTPVHESKIDGNIFVKNSRWATPSEESAKKRLSKFIDSQSIPRQWALDLSNKLKQEYSLDSICGLLDSTTKDYI